MYKRMLNSVNAQIAWSLALGGVRFFIDLLKQFFHLEHVVQGIVQEERQLGNAAQLFGHPVAQVLADLGAALLDALQHLGSIFDLEHAQVHAGFQQVRGHAHRGNGDHTTVCYIKSHALKDVTQFLLHLLSYLFLTLTFLHIVGINDQQKYEIRRPARLPGA